MGDFHINHFIQRLGLTLFCGGSFMLVNGCGTVVGNGQHISGEKTKRNKKSSPVVAQDASAKEGSQNGTASPIPESNGAPATVVVSDAERAAKILRDLVGVSFTSGCEGIFEKGIDLENFALQFNEESSVNDESLQLASKSRLLFKKYDFGWEATIQFTDVDLIKALAESQMIYPSVRYQSDAQRAWYYASAIAEPLELDLQCELVEHKTNIEINGINGSWQTTVSRTKPSEAAQILLSSWSYQSDNLGVSDVGLLKISRGDEVFRWQQLDLNTLNVPAD
jgi:hypothetical protein